MNYFGKKAFALLLEFILFTGKHFPTFPVGLSFQSDIKPFILKEAFFVSDGQRGRVGQFYKTELLIQEKLRTASDELRKATATGLLRVARSSQLLDIYVVLNSDFCHIFLQFKNKKGAPSEEINPSAGGAIAKSQVVVLNEWVVINASLR